MAYDLGMGVLSDDMATLFGRDLISQKTENWLCRNPPDHNHHCTNNRETAVAENSHDLRTGRLHMNRGAYPGPAS